MDGLDSLVLVLLVFSWLLRISGSWWVQSVKKFGKNMRSALSWVDMLDFIVSISRHFLFNKSAVSVKEAVCLEGGTPASIYLQFLSLPSLPSISH